jgi:hypothetical protein
MKWQSFLHLLPALLLFMISSSEAEILGFDASWQVTERGAESGDDLSAYQQRYHLTWYPQVTRAFSFDADMNYSRQWTTSRGTREIVSPTLNALLQNDLFQVEFNGVVNEILNSDSRDQSSRTWETVVSSNWTYPYWPGLRLIAGGNTFSDSGDDPVTDSERDWYEFIAEWEMDTLATYYSYYTQVRTNRVEGSEYDEGRHFGRLDYGRAFLGTRGQLTFSQQFTDSVTDITAAVGEGDRINIAVGLSQALAAVDPVPERGSLPGNPGLIDGNRNSTAFTINLQETANLAVKADLQRVDFLYVYTGEIDPVLIGETDSLRWDLYTSRDGVDWQRERINPPTRYNRDEFRYEVDVGGTESIYLKLVVTGWPLNLAVPVTEIEAYRSRTGTGTGIDETQKYRKYLTDFNVRFDPTRTTRVIYSLVWDNFDNEPGNDRDRLFQSGSIRWLVSRYFVPSITVNETRTDNSETADDLFRSYGISIRSTPFPTLDSTLSITRNENYEDDEIISRNHTVNMLTSAILYPNLESTLDINIILNENEFSDRSSDALGVRWTLTGRLRPGLIADLITEYGSNTIDFSEAGSDEDSGGRTSINVNYRPSDRVSFLVNASRGYGEQWENYNSLYFDSNFSVLRTAKSQLILGYRINANDESTVNNFNLNWGWNISPYLTFQTYANYLLTDDEDTWALNARLTARF